MTVTLPGHEECAVEDLGISVAGQADERLPSELTKTSLLPVPGRSPRSSPNWASP